MNQNNDTPATPSADEEIATPRILRVEGPHECTRSVNDPKDVHYSVFDETGGNVAHFSKREDAEQYVDLISHANERELATQKQLIAQYELDGFADEKIITDLKAELATAQSVIESLKRGHHAYVETHRRAIETSRALRTQNASLRSQLTEAQKDLSRSREEITELSARLFDSGTQLTEAQEWRNEAEKKLFETGKLIPDLVEKLTEAQAEKERIRGQLISHERMAAKGVYVETEKYEAMVAQLTEANAKLAEVAYAKRSVEKLRSEGCTPPNELSSLRIILNELFTVVSP